VSSVSVSVAHALALTEEGLVYAWGKNIHGALLGNPQVEKELLPKPFEALRGVRVGSVSAGECRSYAVADTGELWAWGVDSGQSIDSSPLGHGEQRDCPVPKPIESLRGIKVDALTTGYDYTLAVADDGGVYVWGRGNCAESSGALGLGPSVGNARRAVPTPQRISALRVACGL
jgi:alpha-tubulin suppressor-like RCC1 family protein